MMKYFINKMKDFDPGSPVIVDKGHWKQQVRKLVDSVMRHMPPTMENCRGGIYSGCAGIAYAFYYLSKVEEMSDWKLSLLRFAKPYMDVAVEFVSGEVEVPHPESFLLESAGVFAVASLVYDSIGLHCSAKDVRQKYQQLAGYLKPGSDEFFMGRTGYLCGAFLLNKTYDQQIVPNDVITVIGKSIVQSGHEYSTMHRCSSPLMYSFNNKEYLGASHGLSSILHMLMSCDDIIKSDWLSTQHIRDSIDYLLCVMLPDGAIPATLEEVKPRPCDEEYEHVDWCHGSPGMIYMFAKAYKVFKDCRYLEACLTIGELTWKRGLLRSGSGLRHGLSGCGYVFLVLYRLTNDNLHLHRALKFAQFMETDEYRYHEFYKNHHCHHNDAPYSLYEGLAGIACFLADLTQPDRAEFPFFDFTV